MAGLSYSVDDLVPPNKNNSITRAFDEVKKPSAQYGTPIQPMTPVFGELNPDSVDKNRIDKLFMDTKQLDECIAQAENLHDMLHSDSSALKVVGLLSFGLRKSGELLSVAIYEHKMSKVNLKRVQSVASQEKFWEYLREAKDKNGDVKPTDKAKEHYMNIDVDVIKAAEKEAVCEAILTQLETYRTQFTMAMSAVKAMLSKQRGDSLISDSATPTANAEPLSSNHDYIPF